jgi:hypothetical protein
MLCPELNVTRSAAFCSALDLDKDTSRETASNLHNPYRSRSRRLQCLKYRAQTSHQCMVLTQYCRKTNKLDGTKICCVMSHHDLSETELRSLHGIYKLHVPCCSKKSNARIYLSLGTAGLEYATTHASLAVEVPLTT